MTTLSEAGGLLLANLENYQSPESLQAAEMVRRHYHNLGARAVVLMDKDDTTINMENGIPTDPRLENIIAQAQERGIIVSYDSDSSSRDLEGQLGMKGLPIAERGGLIRLPDGGEIHLVQSGEWFRQLLTRFTGRVLNDKNLHDNITVLVTDPWPLLFADTRFPGSQRGIVFVNSGRKVTASIVTGLLDQSQGGRVIRHTPESQEFYRQMADIFEAERDALLQEKPFPDSNGIVNDMNRALELVIFKSAIATKQRAVGWISQAVQPLGIKIYHIGDSKSDDMTDIPGVVTMAVGNGELRDIPGVIVAQQPMASGVVELFENYIFTQN
jgi:hypothetical protein